ncbi:multiheme c-type cytochrome [Sulfurihydrogenibium subterraneum]|uniref:multiheme c-type cytochrome n=1 Tax=Sulfurihydrogenibium subterraneum TaxID=171121 RepID=UPI000490559F|nr:multiheme c-type cytochrome [Sulfurihydrogenibium subterraneum]
MRFIIILLGGFLLFSCDKVKDVFQEKDLLQRPVAQRCSDCHQNIYKQWKDSRHAVAWTSPEFKRASENYTKTKCLSCHAAYEITVNDKPNLRDFHKEDGVNCAACHFRDSTKSMHGPYDVFSPPHPSTQDLQYTKAEICSGCHQETYKQWKTVATDKNCQQCHMPAEKGKLIQKFPFDLFHASKEIHHHGFMVPKSKKDFFDVKVSKDSSALVVKITNLKVPHNVPTADHGNPKYYVDIVIYKDGKEVYSDSQMITPKEAFLPKQEKVINISYSEDYDKVKVILSRKLSWQKEAEKIASYDF